MGILQIGFLGEILVIHIHPIFEMLVTRERETRTLAAPPL